MEKLAILQLFCLSVLPSINSVAVPCDKEFSSKCLCGEIKYGNKIQYVVNCTYTNFQNASVLQNLPPNTQVLIFTGNNISELPVNVFVTTNTFLHLKVVDMSNNNMQDIRGKSYHRVSNVERLILNHNKISISSKEPNPHHPRIFSIFENLLELHLTDAFADNTPAEDLASDLNYIFMNSDFEQLQKLHLEQNELSQFKDPRVFCDLPNLQDLHLGQNKLSGLQFYIDCLPKLRFLDLEFNEIKGLNKEDRQTLDKYAASHTHNLTIELSDNCLIRDCSSLYTWVETSKVRVRNEDKLHCHESIEGRCPIMLTTPLQVSSSHTGTELFLLTAICIFLAVLLYTNRRRIERQMRPLMDAVSRKVHYTNIGNQEEQEMNV